MVGNGNVWGKWKIEIFVKNRGEKLNFERKNKYFGRKLNFRTKIDIDDWNIVLICLTT